MLGLFGCFGMGCVATEILVMRLSPVGVEVVTPIEDRLTFESGVRLANRECERIGKETPSMTVQTPSGLLVSFRCRCGDG